MPAFSCSQTLDHGTANPIVARLAVQTFEIVEHCNVPREVRDSIKDIYFNSLVKKLLRCWEIVDEYRLEFTKQIESYLVPNVQTFELRFDSHQDPNSARSR